MMRKHIRGTFLAAAAVVAGLTACNNDKLIAVNENPNAPAQASSASLFTNATVSALSRIRGSGFEHGFSGVWDQHYAETQYAETDLNNPRNANVEAHWNGFYVGPFQDYNQILAQSTANANLIGPAMVMRAFVVETMTDLWGDIPFTEAGKGSANLTPKYDAQAVIYDSLFVSLTQAASIMKASSDPSSPLFARYGAADPVYGNNGESETVQAAQWVKLANSLHARAAMRISATLANPTKAKAELVKALAGPVFTSNADNALMTWPGGTVSNPLCLNWLDSECGGTRDDQRLSERFIDTLKVTGDPRLFVYADPTAASFKASPTSCDLTYKGMPNGHVSMNVPNPCNPGKNFGGSNYSRPALAIRLKDSPSYIMTYSELLFIEAEAAERAFIAGSAAAFYTAAIRASMEQWGVPSADIDAYLAKPAVAYQGGAAGLKQIAYEKWVALFNLETEAYAEYRRLNYPILTPGPSALTSTIPGRVPYPDIENSLNKANLAAAKTAQGATDVTGKVWWDK